MKRSGLGASPLFIKGDISNQSAKKLAAHHNAAEIKEPVPLFTRAFIDDIRRSVRETGKEATTHRLSIKERKALLEIVYHYKLQGVRTNENEIARIALNILIQDYKERKQDSLLARVMAVLHD